MPSRTVPPPRLPSPDRVDAEDRKLIERHIAEKGVTRVPRGQTAFDPAHPISMQEQINAGHRAAARRRRFEKLQRAAAPPASRASAPVPARKSPPRREASPEDALAEIPAFRITIEAPRFIRTWRDSCRFEVIPVADLRIREGAYQRVLGRNAARRIKRLAAGFDWARFGALTVRRIAGGFEVIDGQHRAAAARLRGIRMVPAIVVEAEGAGVFLGLNRDRANLDSAQLYHAELAAGEPEAVALGAVLDRAGVTVPRTARQKALGPLETRAVSALRLELRARGAAVLGWALGALARAWPAAPGAVNAETVRALARVVHEIDAAPDRGRSVTEELAALTELMARRDPAGLRARARAAAAECGGAAHLHLARLICNAHAEAGGVEIAVGV